MVRSVAYFTAVGILAGLSAAVRFVLPDEWTAGPADTSSVPRRIASLSPSTTELCAALGLIDHLVARSSFCDWPAEVSRIPAVGGLLDPDRERLMYLHPDLVLLPGRSRMLQEAVANTGLRSISLPDSTLDDVYSSLRTLGRLTGRDALAASRIAAIRTELSEIAAHARPAGTMRVLLVVSESRIPPVPPYVAGPGSYLDGLLRMAGHENAMASLDRGWAQISLEDVVRADPDAIIEFWPEARPQARDLAVRAWTQVGAHGAVVAGRIYVISGRNHYVPGPRVAQTLRAMATCLSGAETGSGHRPN